MTSNIEAMIDKTSYFGSTLNIPNIKPYNSYVWFGKDFDDSWSRCDHNIIEYVIVLYKLVVVATTRHKVQ